MQGLRNKTENARKPNSFPKRRRSNLGYVSPYFRLEQQTHVTSNVRSANVKENTIFLHPKIAEVI
ncbi:hypothetical protein C0J52_11445 [Blattella germanica]|nr:hypothetical protein C0J52_11445 [Blattella germanica]